MRNLSQSPQSRVGRDASVVSGNAQSLELSVASAPLRKTSEPLFADAARSSALITELNSWLSTPWAHRAAVPGPQLAVKGVGGDCVTILLCALYNIEALEQFDLPAHVALPGMAADDDVAESITKFVRPFIESGRLQVVDWPRAPLMVGDFLAFRRRAARDHHLGMYRGGPDKRFYHAPGPGCRFCLASLNQASPYLSSVYRLCVLRDLRGEQSAIPDSRSAMETT